MSRATQSSIAPESADRPVENALEPSGVIRSDERRRLLRGGLAAGPVIMTVMSRPVFGLPTCNYSQASGAGSICTAPPVPGYSISYWSRTTSWPTPYVCGSSGSGGYQSFAQVAPSGQSGSSGVNQGTLYHSSTTGLTGNVFGSHTMLQVLQGNAGGGAYKTLGRYVAAALLNAAAGRTPFLAQASIQKMWNQDLTLGYFEVSPGVRWSTSQIVSYLQSTMS